MFSNLIYIYVQTYMDKYYKNSCSNTRDTRLSVFALELIRSASNVLTSLRRFIGAIWTILFTITNPSLMNAANTVIAIELLIRCAMACLPCIRLILQK